MGQIDSDKIERDMKFRKDMLDYSCDKESKLKEPWNELVVPITIPVRVTITDDLCLMMGTMPQMDKQIENALMNLMDNDLLKTIRERRVDISRSFVEVFRMQWEDNRDRLIGGYNNYGDKGKPIKAVGKGDLGLDLGSGTQIDDDGSKDAQVHSSGNEHTSPVQPELGVFEGHPSGKDKGKGKK